jgi:hypothetical protein
MHIDYNGLRERRKPRSLRRMCPLRLPLPCESDKRREHSGHNHDDTTATSVDDLSSLPRFRPRRFPEKR